MTLRNGGGGGARCPQPDRQQFALAGLAQPSQIGKDEVKKGKGRGGPNHISSFKDLLATGTMSGKHINARSKDGGISSPFNATRPNLERSAQESTLALRVVRLVGDATRVRVCKENLHQLHCKILRAVGLVRLTWLRRLPMS